MDLILWRHADAEEGADDLARALTPKGDKQAARMGGWLDARLPKSARVLVSPALRAQQTAKALARKSETVDALKPGSPAAAILKAAGWPAAEGAVVLVGHQPTLGAAAALALTGKPVQWRVRKGAIWWLSVAPGESSPLLTAVLSPDLT